MKGERLWMAGLVIGFGLIIGGSLLMTVAPFLGVVLFVVGFVIVIVLILG